MATPLKYWGFAGFRTALPAGLCALLFFLPAFAGARSLLDDSASCPAGAQSCFTADGSTQYCCPANWGCCSGPDLTCYPQGQAYPSDPNDFVRNGFLPGTLSTASPVPALPTPAATQSASNPASGAGKPQLAVTVVTDVEGTDFGNNQMAYEPECPPGTLATGGGCHCGHSDFTSGATFGPVLVSNFAFSGQGWRCVCPTCPPSTLSCVNLGTVACASLTF